MAAETSPKPNPMQAFRARTGVEPSPLHISLVSSNLLRAMEQGALAYRELLRGDRADARVGVASAVVGLFPDGPVERIYGDGYTTQPPSRNPGEKAQRIIDEFMDGVTNPLEATFREAADLISVVSGVDLRFLNDHFLKKTPSELLTEARAEEQRLNNKFWNLQKTGEAWDFRTEPELWDRARKQAVFLQNGGILTAAQFAEEHRKSLASNNT